MNRASDWSFRLYQESKVATSTDFLTLTYEDWNLPIQNAETQEINYYHEVYETGIPAYSQATLWKRDLQLFFKRLRKKYTIRYYAVGEYGSKTYRPHYHIILFNLPREARIKIEDIWQRGSVQFGTVTEASIHYVTTYIMTKNQEFKGREPPFSLMSQKPPLGINYYNKYKKLHADENRHHVSYNGLRQRIPRLFDNYLHQEAEENQLGTGYRPISDHEITKARILEDKDFQKWYNIRSDLGHDPIQEDYSQRQNETKFYNNKLTKTKL
jgi:hypothetical protein